MCIRDDNNNLFCIGLWKVHKISRVSHKYCGWEDKSEYTLLRLKQREEE